jgi:Gas vesicle synthesis protein GvpO
VDVHGRDDRDRGDPGRDVRPAERRDREPRKLERAGGRPRSAGRTARLAAAYVAEMTGKEPEGITSLERAGDGGWLVGVEVVETRRIPDSTDILAVYEAELDADGELLAYRRVKRYSRCQVGER